MLTRRKAQDRGYADHGWLKSYHSISFADYYDPAHMGWGNLRVINEDRVAPGAGFGRHGHRDMEIVSYVLSGELAHQGSMGNVKGIPPGDVQRMSAGTGVMHSEFNHAKGHTTHFLQIWIRPNVTGIPPSYEQKTIPVEEKRGALRLVASPDGAQGSVTIHADAALYAGLFNMFDKLQNPLALAGRLLLALLFLPAGISKLAGFAGTVGYISSVGLPMPQVGAALALVVEIVGGIALIPGYGTRLAAIVLAVFTLVASFFFHNYSGLPADQQMIQQLLFFKNIAVVGGLLTLAAWGAGAWSLDGRSKA